MKKCKQVKTLRAKDLTELETLINKELMEGAELGAIDLALCVAMVVVTEYVGDIKKTLLDELEDELGRHNCSECPFFVESTDKRKKWHTCKKGKRVQKSSSCCIAYYELTREEETSDLSENQGKNERVRREGRGCRSLAEGITAGGVRQTEWTEQVPTIGVRIPRGIPKDTAGRVV